MNLRPGQADPPDVPASTPDLAAAVALHRQGRLEQAEQLYRQILDREPGQPDALHLLGLVAFQDGRVETALESVRAAIERHPAEPLYHLNLGRILQAGGLASEAQACFERVIQLRPSDAPGYVNLGNIQCGLGQLAAAIDSYRLALARAPDCLEALVNLGFVLRRQGRLDEAAATLRAALEAEPRSPEALLNLGAALQDQGDDAAAVELFAEALRLRPEMAEGHHNLGLSRKRQGRCGEAIDCFRQALRLKPHYAEAAEGLAAALFAQGRVREAVAGFRRALRLKPAPAAHSSLVACLNYLGAGKPAAILEEHHRWARRHADLPAPPRHENSRDSERNLRVGYVSSDFRTHSVAFFFGPILEAHHRPAFQCFCYSGVARPDAVTERLRALADVWREVRHLSHAELAELVRQDRIDILVDLGGHTIDNRLPAFALQPAPIQAGYLGYPNTTGLRQMDYRITDAWADPAGVSESLYTEELIRLPSGFLCYRPFADAPPVADLPALRSGIFTFGSFNHLAKVTPELVAAWSEILRAAPDSRLLLKAQGLQDEAARQRLLDLFWARAIPPERLALIPPAASLLAHLESYHQVDLALDTFPYNGTTTTCEALWMGAPVVTLAGSAHAGRVGVSLLERVGMPELIAESVEAYIDLAVRLSRDRQRLEAWRAGFRARVGRSPLVDAGRFIAELEDAYRAMWRRWCAGQA